MWYSNVLLIRNHTFGSRPSFWTTAFHFIHDFFKNSRPRFLKKWLLICRILLHMLLNLLESKNLQKDNIVGSMEAPSKAFLLFFLLPVWLKLNHLKSRTECGFSDIFSRHICRSRNNRRDKLRSKFWSEKMFRKPHLKLLRWCSVRGTNKTWYFRDCSLTNNEDKVLILRSEGHTGKYKALRPTMELEPVIPRALFLDESASYVSRISLELILKYKFCDLSR